MLSTPLVTAGTAALAVAAVGAAHLARREGPLGGAHLVVAGAVVAVGTALGGVAIIAVLGAVSPFPIAHLLYLAIVLTVPLVGLGLGLLGRRRGASRWVWAVVVTTLLPAPVGVYATHVEPFRLRVDRHAVVLDPARAGDDEVRVAVLADLQTGGVGDHERRAIDEVLAAEPDVILLPGDLFQGRLTDEALAEVRALLGRLEAPSGVWFVRGDTDGGDGGPADRILDGLDIEVLVDEVADVQVGDRTLRIGGTALRYDGPGADAVRADLEATPDDGAITILLSHRPDTALHLPPSSRVDLTVAGHTHGGQIVIPGFGPPMTMSDVPRHVARGGLHDLDGNAVYVSPGVGMERGSAPQVRFLSRPAVGVLTLGGAA